MVEEEEEACLLLPKDFDPRAMPMWLLPPPSAEILFRGPPNLGVAQQQQQPLLSSDSSLSWETFVSWPPPERRRMRRMQGRRENENENLSAKSIVFFNNNDDDDENENENDETSDDDENVLQSRDTRRNQMEIDLSKLTARLEQDFAFIDSARETLNVIERKVSEMEEDVWEKEKATVKTRVDQRVEQVKDQFGRMFSSMFSSNTSKE